MRVISKEEEMKRSARAEQVEDKVFITKRGAYTAAITLLDTAIMLVEGLDSGTANDIKGIAASLETAMNHYCKPVSVLERSNNRNMHTNGIRIINERRLFDLLLSKDVLDEMSKYSEPEEYDILHAEHSRVIRSRRAGLKHYYDTPAKDEMSICKKECLRKPEEDK